MNILFLSIGKLDNIENRGIYTDLLREFRNHGHNVYVVHPLERRLKQKTEYAEEQGIHFLRVKTGNITKTNLLEKGLSTLLIEPIFLKAIKKHINHVKFDLIIYSTPPITFEKILKYIKKRDGAKSYLLLKDIFPQNAVDLGMFKKNSLVYKYFRYKEKQLYNNSDYIGCMSQANVDYVTAHNDVQEKVIEICPNSIEPIEIKIDSEENIKIKKKYNLPFDKTIFIYGGNLGKPQGINFLIECLKSNLHNSKVYFVIAGSGTEFNKLQKFIAEYRPNNVQVIKQLPKDEYENLVNSCDVGLIFLDYRFTIPNFPSRILSYMQSSIPMIAATDLNTDVGSIMEEEGFGFCVPSNNVQAFNKSILEICNKEIRRKMGKRGREYLENNYTVENSYRIIKKHFEK